LAIADSEDAFMIAKLTFSKNRRRGSLQLAVIVGFLVLSALLLAACGGTSAQPTATAAPPLVATATMGPIVNNPGDLLRQPWQWISFRGAAEGFDVQSPLSYLLTFNQNGTVNVIADCNNANGNYTADTSRLMITLGTSTQASCPPGSRSEQFIRLLNGAASYFFQGGDLNIALMLDGGTMTFWPAQPVAVQPTLAPLPTATPGIPVNLPSLPGTVVDRGPRQHASGTYQAPYYTVAGGDTLFSIGLRFGVTVPQLMAANALDNNQSIFAGQRLIIPGSSTAVPVPPTATPGAPVNLPSLPGTVVDRGLRQHATGTYQAPYYTVASGDTLFSIGLRFGVTVPQLLAANALESNQAIFANQKLIISGGSEYERVTFDNGGIFAERTGTISQGQPKGYVLGARAGQTMEINTQSRGVPLGVAVQAPSGAILALNGQNQQVNNVLYVSLPETGDYFITVTPAILPEGPFLDFTITFVVQ
jgi:LysM repeat protein/heat shock protein HslJ